MSQPILLILGAGSNIGAALTTKFSSAGYRIAIAARSLTTGLSPSGVLHIRIDLADPFAIPAVFNSVKKTFGVPSIVVYNAAAITPPPDPENMFSIDVETMARDVRLMTLSAYVAAQETVAGWEAERSNGGKKVFIYTGNCLNTMILPTPYVLTLGVGKAGAAYWIGTAAAVYKEKGFKFYYADQRTPAGRSMGTAVDGPAHAEFFYKLATEEAGVPWDATFVKGKGYVEFKTT